jgi:hypothetical protein
MNVIPPSPRRACGERKPGGIYIEVGLGGSLTIEQAMFDPPLPADGVILELPGGEYVTADALGARGQVVARIPGHDAWHVWDVVGRRDYPYPADFLEEVRTEGLSRRSPRGLRFDLLGAESRIFLLHEQGWFENPHDYYAALPEFRCPRQIAHALGEPCAGLWWCDIAEGDSQPVAGLTFQGQPARKRTIGRRTYRCAARPEGIAPRYARAVIASFRIWRLAVVQDQAGQAEIARQQAAQSRLPVAMIEE